MAEMTEKHSAEDDARWRQCSCGLPVPRGVLCAHGYDRCRACLEGVPAEIAPCTCPIPPAETAEETR